MSETAIIIGAGPAGLTAALELLRTTGIVPMVLEASSSLGGISKTVRYKGNRMDIGPHRFFTKSDRVMAWWQEILPLQAPDTPDASTDPRVLLTCKRHTRILYRRRFFDYPIRITPETICKMGVWGTAHAALSYARAALRPIAPEANLESFLINRFGRKLYRDFFQSYTEKVWGVPCHQISADWGAQRIKGLSIRSAVAHFFRIWMCGSVQPKSLETSLVEHFYYPKLGAGQMWEETANRVTALGGRILLGHTVAGIEQRHGQVTAVRAVIPGEPREIRFETRHLFSSMPVKDLIAAMGEDAPATVRSVANGLVYRNTICVGVLARRLTIRHNGKAVSGPGLPDHWIYLQDPDIRMGRMVVFNNWSPALLNDPDTIWLGVEYFVNQDDTFWSMTDVQLSRFAVAELVRIGIIDAQDLLDTLVLREPKTYPAYFGAYGQFNVIRAFLDSIPNLYPIGRNGMHRYNNLDHSMLTAMEAVQLLASGNSDKSSVWDINTEQDYHEEKSDV